jgi:hypothetical protein
MAADRIDLAHNVEKEWVDVIVKRLRRETGSKSVLLSSVKSAQALSNSLCRCAHLVVQEKLRQEA